MARVVILGGGFAAIAAAEKLSTEVGDEHEILVVSKSTEFTFYPAIVPMIFGNIMPEEITTDLPPRLAERNIRFMQGAVRSINAKRKTVDILSQRSISTIGYDQLLVAVGRRLGINSVPGLSEHSLRVLSVPDALEFKEAISAFESGSIVLGLCPDATLPVPVCEIALGLAKKFEDEIQSGTVSITIVVPTTLEKAFAGSALFRDVEEEFDRKGIRLLSEFAVTAVETNRLYSALGATIRHDLLMLVPPFGGRLSLRSLGPVTDISGFAKVNSLMQVIDLDGVYAAGDVVATPGPKFGYMAIRQGKVAASNIVSELRGEAPTEEYAHKIAWAISEKYTDPVFFHYGFWDDTLEDFDEDVLFGMAKSIRDRYGPILKSTDPLTATA